MTPASTQAEGRTSSRAALIAILLLTAAIILAWSHFKLLDQDEVFVLQTDSVRSLRQLLDVQLHYPISLDPLFYHLLGHAFTKVFGATAFAVRLPSLLGYLLMQLCLFFIAKSLFTDTETGERAGILAAAIPALTATLFYGVEARPYGLLLGLAALMLLSWQRATRAALTCGRNRDLALLALSTALALNTHYFAVLLLIPLCAAELFRILRTRRIDWPVVASIVAGTACIAFTLPFMKGAGEFRKHYYNAGRVSLHAVTQSYRALLVNYTDYSNTVQHALIAILALLTLAFLAALALRLRSKELNLTSAELVFLLVLAALPLFGFLMARFVTHSIEVRYVLSAIIALAVLIAAVAAPVFRVDERSTSAITAILLLVTVAAGAERIREEHTKTAEHLAALQLSPATQAALAAHPGPLYIQNLGNFDEYGSYIADPALKPRLTLVYSSAQEIALNHHDTQALTAEHMQHFTPLPIATWEDLQHQPGEHLVILYHGGGWNWLDTALARDGISVQPLGRWMAGDLVAVSAGAGR